MIGKMMKNECQYCQKSNHSKEKCFWNPNNLDNKLKEKQEVVVNEVVAQQSKHET